MRQPHPKTHPKLCSVLIWHKSSYICVYIVRRLAERGLELAEEKWWEGEEVVRRREKGGEEAKQTSLDTHYTITHPLHVIPSRALQH